MAAKKLAITFSNGKTVQVQPTLEDRLKFESTLRKNRGWGELKDNAMKLTPFLAWSAARRNNDTDLTWEQFTTGPTAALDVEEVDESKDDDDEAADAEAELEVDGLGKGTAKKSSRTTT